MVSYNSEMLNEYLKDDWILKLIKENENEYEKEIRTNKWLFEMDNKRIIYSDVYGDILKNDEENGKKRVLDIGGGGNYTVKDFSEKFRLYSL